MASNASSQIVGGTFETDGTTGTNLSNSAIITDYSIEVTDGVTNFTHAPANSTFAHFAGGTITATKIIVLGIPRSRRIH